MNRLRGVLWGARWSDGRRVSYGHDQMARSLLLVSLGLPAAGLVLYFWKDSFAVLVLFWLGGVALGLVANARLLVIVSRIEKSDAGVPPLPPTLLDRLCEFAARYDERKEAKLLARSAKAEARGDHRAADRHRASAARARKSSDETRRLMRSSARDGGDSSGPRKATDPVAGAVVADSAAGAVHEVAAPDADYAGGFDGFG